MVHHGTPDRVALSDLLRDPNEREDPALRHPDHVAKLEALREELAARDNDARVPAE